MKVVISGSGAQGTGLAGLLVMEKDVEQLILADYSQASLDKAKQLIDSLGEKIQTKQILYRTVNAGSVEEVATLLEGSDICFHAIVPKFNLPIMKACLKAHTHYMDLIGLPGSADDGDETIGAQIALFDDFAKAGLIAIPSIGISPGWTLLAAADMIEDFDTVDEVKIRWADYLDTDEFTSSINPTFMLSEWLGAPHPCAYKDGDLICESLLESEEEFEFPDPIGVRKIYTCTSQPDIVMIPEFSPIPILYCVEKGSANTSALSMKEIWLHALQQAASADTVLDNGTTILDEMGKTLIPPNKHDELYAEGKIKDHATCFSVEVNGKKEDKHVRHIQYNNCTKATAIRHLPWSTPAVYDTAGGLPVILTLMIGRGEIQKHGVFSAGQLGISKQLKEELKKRDHDITEKIIIDC